jgi:hypothetical protein
MPAFKSNYKALLFCWKFACRFLIFGVLIFGYGCATKKVVISYHPQENVIPLKEAGEIGVKVKTFDLRIDKAAGSVGSFFITAKNELKNLVSHAIETELLNRGFKLGESVLIEIDLIDFKNYFLPLPRGGRVPKVSAEITFHVSVKNSRGVLVFQSLVRQRGGYSIMRAFGKWDTELTFGSAFKAGILQVVNDPEFINFLIKANSK